jgi:cytochrome P450
MEMNPFVRWNPLRPLCHWYYGQLMDRYISRHLDSGFAAHQRLRDAVDSKDDEYRTVMDLALDKFLDEQSGPNDHRSMNTEFKRFAINQMKIFILAGHDTTSATLCYVFYLLSRHPSTLQRVRAEHDEVFGSDLSKAAAHIEENPQALNRLPFTLAVIKETLRLFPVASGTREGEPGFFLHHDGHQYPTEGVTLWCTHQAMHREPLYWPKPDSFVPERWMISDDDSLHSIKDAWRPFERGPRNCIGQELALVEMKLVMVMALRRFDITASYDVGDHDQAPKERKTVYGDRAYQVLNGTTRPAEGFPCRVTLATP